MNTFTRIVASVLFFGLTLFVSVAKANYQHELTILHHQSDGTTGKNDFNSEARFVYFSHFFDTVDASTGPRLLAPFIQRAGFVSFGTVTSESTYNTSSSDSRSYYMAAQITDKESPFVLGFSYGQGDSDTTGSSSYSSDNADYGLSAGYYIQQYTLVTLGHSESKTENSNNPDPLESKTNDIGISSVQLREAGSAIALSAAYRVTKYKSGTEHKFTNLTADYYLNPRLGLGIYILTTKSTIDANNSKTLGINASYFINPQFEVSAAYSKDKPDNTLQGIESKAIQLAGSFYF